MKRIAKKNQIIITSLAILIAIAGYLNYTQKNAVNQKEETKKDEAMVNGDVVDDTYSFEVAVVPDDETLPDGETVPDDKNMSDESTNPSADSITAKESTEPGEAIFTNATTFSANAKLNREQVRASNKETIMNALNAQGITDAERAKLTDQLVSITKAAELENEIEMLLSAKGYVDAVVSLGDGTVDVVVNHAEVTDVNRAQIEDIVKRKSGLSASSITITPMFTEN